MSYTCPVNVVVSCLSCVWENSFRVTIAEHAITDFDAALGIKNFENCALLCYYAVSKMGPIGLSRNVGEKLPLLAA